MNDFSSKYSDDNSCLCNSWSASETATWTATTVVVTRAASSSTSARADRHHLSTINITTLSLILRNAKQAKLYHRLVFGSVSELSKNEIKDVTELMVSLSLDSILTVFLVVFKTQGDFPNDTLKISKIDKLKEIYGKICYKCIWTRYIIWLAIRWNPMIYFILQFYYIINSTCRGFSPLSYRKSFPIGSLVVSHLSRSPRRTTFITIKLFPSHLR